jgi:tetratricopeptide (TPR) repeat protein
LPNRGREVEALALAVLSGRDDGDLVTSAMAGAAVADAAIEELSADSPARFVTIVRKRRAYTTPYVAARLLDWYDDSYLRWPSEYAIAVTAAALDICNRLDPFLPVLQCRAEKEMANALRAAGRYDEAMAMARRGEQTAALTANTELNRAPLKMVMALIRLDARRPLEALALIAEAKELFRLSQQPWRSDKCRTMEATALYVLGRYDEARAIYLEMLRTALDEQDQLLVGLQLGNMAHCDLVLGETDRARSYFRSAQIIYDRLDLAIPRARMLRELGRLSIREHGRLDEMFEVLAEFDRLGRPDEWVLTQLEIAEELAARGDVTLVVKACQQALTRAVAYGLNVDAANALANLLDLARAGDATADLIRAVTRDIDVTIVRPVQSGNDAVN